MKNKIQIAPLLQQYQEVVRVAVLNNFNCTEAEYAQVDQYRDKYPERFFYVNCNVKTPRLISINQHDYKAVITLNPDLIVREDELCRFYEIDPAKVAFVRVKYLPDNSSIVDLITELHSNEYSVVVTPQRFNSKASLYHYANPDCYHLECTRYRLHGEALSKLHALVDSYNPATVYICDRLNLGCSACQQCSTLTTGQKLRIASLDLSSSGVCPYSCPDCYAKAIQVRYKRIKFDAIKRNDKQTGQTVHILRALAAKA